MFFQKSPVLFPPVLENALVSAFEEESSLKRNAQVLKKLWVELAPKRGQEPIHSKQNSKKYSMTREMTQAYGAYYLPANLMKLSLIIKEARLLNKGELSSSVRWMDFGCGPGTALWGLVAAELESGKAEIQLDYIGVDESKNFISLAKDASEKLRQTLNANNLKTNQMKTHWELSASLEGYLSLIEKNNPDVICFMNSLGEIFPKLSEKNSFLDAIQKLCQQRKRNLKIIILEPGTKAASRELLEWREQFRLLPTTQIYLPCLDNRPCGAFLEKHEWCHEDADAVFPDWFQELGREAGLVKESLLFSYLFFEVGRFVKTEALSSLKNANSTHLTQCRVVSQRMQPKGMTQCFLCTQQGRVKARVLTSREDQNNHGFVNAVRGQIWSEVELSEKGDVLSLKD